jgi:hypothetical protein
MAQFSAAWALKRIKGDREFDAFLATQKTLSFDYYLADGTLDDQYPLIEQEGYDSGSIIGANYRKGPVIVNQIRLELGDELFFKSLKAFTEKYKGKNVTMAHFIETFNMVAGKDLRPLFQDLCWSKGYPSYRLVHFESARQKEKYLTRVRIKNEGAIAAMKSHFSAWIRPSSLKAISSLSLKAKSNIRSD